LGAIMSVERQVAEHYTQDMDQKILDKLRSAGKNLEALSAQDLEPFDNLHLGGSESVEALSSFMDLQPGMQLLDVGCGAGGPARYFAQRGYRVTGIDLSEGFVRAARSLTELVRLSPSAQFHQGSALEMPFESGSFDRAYMIHVGMNIQDKSGVFHEVARVLKPGGRFGIFDILRTSDAGLPFPQPWALTADTSFVETAEHYSHALKAAGFRIAHQRSRRQFAMEVMEKRHAQVGTGGVLAIHLLMGDYAPLMLKNVNQAIAGGILEPVELLAVKS